MADRRYSERTTRRVPVRFTPRGGTPRLRKGYTTNISEGGMFIAAASPYRSGTRLRLEVGEEGEAFAVEGRVVYSRKLAPELYKLGQSGMGIELLSVAELVQELLGQSVTEADEAAGLGDAQETFRGDDVYRLRFPSVAELVRVYRKDVVHGGLFVPTRKPAELSAQITLEVELPAAGLEPLRLSARVVQRIDPEGAGARPNLLAGIGVQFEDQAAAKEEFEGAVEKLQM